MSNVTEDFTLTPEIIDILLKADPDIKSKKLNFKSLDDVWEYLNNEEKQIDAKLNEYDSSDVDLQDHMEQLHQYNNMKDITQEVLGALANLLKISVSEAHQKFNLDEIS